MRKNKGFTLIELMVVILIVAILAAVLAPMLTGRVRDAKWSEGKAGAGTIATAIRAYWAEHEGPGAGEADISAGFDGSAGADQFDIVGLTDVDLEGKYFEAACYSVGAIGGDASSGPTYTITINADDSTKGGAPTGSWTLDNTGTWTKLAVTP